MPVTITAGISGMEDNDLGAGDGGSGTRGSRGGDQKVKR
jgi:hypothetical protein